MLIAFMMVSSYEKRKQLKIHIKSLVKCHTTSDENHRKTKHPKEHCFMKSNKTATNIGKVDTR